MAEAERAPNGQFIPGGVNPWRMPAYKPGQSGHTARYTATRLANVCAEYMANRNGQRSTWSGLAAYLGISRQALDRYAKGEFGKDTRAIVAVLEYYRTLMEAELEQRLTSKDHATQGVIFALKNQAGWRDEKHLSVEQTQTQRLVIQLPSELNQLLTDRAGEALGDVIEGEVVE